MSNQTKLVAGAASRLAALIHGHARDAGRQLGEWLRPWLRDGEDLPDFALVLDLPARMFEHAAARLRRYEEELADARSREAEARFQRSATASALRRKLVDVRRLLTAVHGPRRTTTLLGIEGGTAHDTQPALLLSHAGAFQELLRDPQQMVVTRADFTFDPAAIADGVETLAAACGEAGARLDAVRKVSADRREARDHTRSELARAVGCVVGVLGGWFRLIRRSDLARKLTVQR